MFNVVLQSSDNHFVKIVETPVWHPATVCCAKFFFDSLRQTHDSNWIMSFILWCWKANILPFVCFFGCLEWAKPSGECAVRSCIIHRFICCNPWRMHIYCDVKFSDSPSVLIHNIKWVDDVSKVLYAATKSLKFNTHTFALMTLESCDRSINIDIITTNRIDTLCCNATPIAVAFVTPCTMKNDSKSEWGKAHADTDLNRVVNRTHWIYLFGRCVSPLRIRYIMAHT